MARQENTRQKIIDASFKIVSEKNYAKFSLSEIAKEVGISKAAIFRHFKNKEELQAEMRLQFMTDFSKMDITKIEETGNVEMAVSAVVDFFSDKPEYLCYYLNTVVCNKGFLNDLSEVIANSKFSDHMKNFFLGSTFPEKKSFFSMYCGITIVFFLVVYQYDSRLMDSRDNLKKRISAILLNGMGKDKVPVSPERRKELDELCKFEFTEIPEKHNRFFKGFIEVFKRTGFQNLTVEKLAAEVGISKSSIYSFYESKNDFIDEMLEKEIHLATVSLMECCTVAENTDEMIYVLLRSVTNYFIERPYMVMLHTWMSFQGKMLKREQYQNYTVEFPDSIMPENFPFKNAGKNLFISWISGVCVIFMLIGMQRLINDEWNEKSVSYVYDFIQCGLKINQNTGDAK